MYDIIYNTLNLINFNNPVAVNHALKSLEQLFTGIIPNVYFCRQEGEFITWIIKSYDRGEFCKVIISRDTFEII